MGFSSLRDKLNKTANLQSLISQAEKLKTSFTPDERYWNLTVDKNGNGSAVIRFLPPPEGEDVPFVRLWSHSFKGPTGQWYIENSLTTIGQQDEISQLNAKLWNSGSESDKDIARKQKRKLHYISNILVVKDSACPENEGKVFLFKYGQKIFDKINSAMNPEFDDQDAMNPFDMWEGANFRLRAKNKDGFRNYDDSVFDSPSALLGGDDEALEKVYNNLYSLQEEIAPNKFKTPAELEARLRAVLGGNEAAVAMEPVEESPIERVRSEPAPVVQTKVTPKHPLEDDDEDEDPMAYFASLAK